AFYNMSDITGVIFPDTLISIGVKSFYNCTGLTTLTFSDSVEYINDEAFRSCTGLKRVVAGKRLKRIGINAFYDCARLEDVITGRGLEEIYPTAFKNCVSLKNMVVPDTVTSIYYAAFEGCALLENIAIPKTVKYIGDDVFKGCSANLTIHCNTDSYAETYAKSKNITYDTSMYNCSQISNSTVFTNETVTVYCGATGGTLGDTFYYQYHVAMRESSSMNYTSVQPYSINSTVTLPEITKAGEYKVLVLALDGGGTTKTMSFTLTVKEPLENDTTVSSTRITAGEKITITGQATGGTAPYEYKFMYKLRTAIGYTTISDYGMTSTQVWKPTTAGLYDVRTIVRDSTCEEVIKNFQINVQAPLENNSTISSTTITKGDSVTITGKATGGATLYNYKYAFTAKHSTATDWTTLKGYNITSTKTWTPGKTGTYSVCAKVKDSDGTEVKKFFTLTVNEALVNNSTISKTTINKGDSVTLKAVAAGGTAPYQYAFTAKHSTATDWTSLKGYNTTSTKTWTPGKTGTYQVCAKVKDANGTEVKKFFTLTINAAPLTNNSTISKTTINKGGSVTLKAVAAGGTSPYQYAFTAKHSTATDWTTLKGYNTTSTKTWTPGLTGTYQICAKVKDAKGTEVKKFFTLTVNAASGLANISTISKTTINKGESVTLTGLGAGGTTPYQYAFSAKHSTATTWTSLKGYNTTSTKVWTPGLKGTYEVCAKVKDAKGTEVKKFFTLTVN
ncbi:MAG: leucine-rich repeat protein, partial [Acutalibacteraceae bacterium]